MPRCYLAPRLSRKRSTHIAKRSPSIWTRVAAERSPGIGAGQEVVRWFFRVGGAAGTIAKSISKNAYDMAVSDAIYGHTERYVARKRLQSMLDHEHELNLQRLREALPE